MISSKKLIKLASKWQKLTSLRRKRISWSQSTTTMSADPCSASSTTDKGHFVVYSIDGRRFQIPLVYLRNQIVAELLQAAEEEFGLPRDRLIMLACDGILLDYALSLVQRRMSKDLQRALVMSIARGLCSSSELAQVERNHCTPLICRIY